MRQFAVKEVKRLEKWSKRVLLEVIMEMPRGEMQKKRKFDAQFQVVVKQSYLPE